MKTIQLATIAIVLGTIATCPVYGQSPGYGGYLPPPDSQQGYNQTPGYGGWYPPQSEVGFFYDELSPYGDWVLTGDYGWAWFPRNVHSYWRPYNDGRWVITEYGWTWVSFEPFGWATYHYGRWAWDPYLGWLWVPGTTWGPAWVSWQHGGGYIGWAPLPPAVGYQLGIGIRLGGFDLKIGIRPDAYNFVQERSFLEPRLLRHLLPTARNVTIIHSTKNITDYTDQDHRVVNRGVDVRRIEQVTGRRVQQLHVVDSGAKTRTGVGRSEVRIFRPQQQQLESVRSGPRNTKGQPEAPPAKGPDRSRPTAERRDAPELVVAPRSDRTPRIDPKKLEQQERREQQELKRFQAKEKQKLEQLQRLESAKARAQAERRQVEKNHQAEREALQEQQRNAAQQLEVRQQAKRQAAQAKPPGRTAQQDKQKLVDQHDQHDQHEKKDKKR